MSSIEQVSVTPEQHMSLRDRAHLLGLSTVASLAVIVPGVASANSVERATTGGPVAEASGDTSAMSEDELQKYCVQEALFSFESGYVAYGRPDSNGRYFKVKHHVEASPLSNDCDDGVVHREIGVQQNMGRSVLRPNTDYSVVSQDEGAVNRTVNQRGQRAWKCFKRFNQSVFITVTTPDGFGGQKVYTGATTKPNC